MKLILLASSALFALGASAFAADLPARAPAMAPAPVFTGVNWSGFYAGLQAGYMWNDNVIREPAVPPFFPPTTTSSNTDAFSFGGQIGYRHQYANGLVVGVEADMSWFNRSRDIATVILLPGGPLLGGIGIGNVHNWDASVRLQMGYAIGAFLPYVTGGVSFLREAGCIGNIAGACVTVPFPVYWDSTRTGWTIGAGVAYAITSNIVAHAEYRYADYGTKNYRTQAKISELQTNKVVVGLSWKFGGATAPVMARY
ncbi:MAG: porin family protein [Beijerinckiaceae bacterium]|nr:porin family protein [Beijerinckiaceae bacterium]